MKKILSLIVVLFLLSCNSKDKVNEEINSNTWKNVIIESNFEIKEENIEEKSVEKNEDKLTEEQNSEIFELKEKVNNSTVKESIKMYDSLIKENPNDETYIEWKENLIRDSWFDSKTSYAEIDKLIMSWNIAWARKMFEELIEKYPENEWLKAWLKDLDNY